MSDIATPILQWINLHPDLAGLATFCISASESIAIIGSIVPGSVMMGALGILAGAGVIPLWPTLLWAILGAIAGDGISYWIGYHFKDRLHVVWPFNRWPNLLETGKDFFQKHGGKSIFIGRFVGPVRAIIPVVSGMFGFSLVRYFIADIPAAILWAPAYMLPGFLLGVASLELSPDIAIHLLAILFIYALIIILGMWLLIKLSTIIKRRINQFLSWLWARLKASHYFRLVTILLKHHDPKKTHGQLVLVFYFIVIATLFLHFLTYVFLKDPQTLFLNNAIYYYFRSIRTPTLDPVMLNITLLGEKTVLVPVAIILFAWFALIKRWHTAWHTLALCIFSVLSIKILKWFVSEPRPWGIIANDLPNGFSFPSGHATLATVFYVGLAILLVGAKNTKFNKFIYAITGIIITAISLSRLYLGAHWLSDIIGGLLFGTLLLMFIGLSYNRKAEKNLRPIGTITITLLALMISYTLVYRHSSASLKYNYTMLEWPGYTISVNNWWQNKGDHLPLYRINRFGSPELFSVEWQGNLSEIKKILLKNGWKEPPDQDWISVIFRITNIRSSEHLPLVSPIHLDKSPVLVLIKRLNNSKKQVVIRFWNSNTDFDNSPQALWVGSIEMISSTYSWLFNHKNRNNFDLTPSLLFTHLPEHYEIKSLTISTIKHNGQTKEQPILFIKPRS